MTDISKRIILFILLCIPSRMYLAFTAYSASVQLLKKMGTVAILPSFGFIYIYLTNSRKTGNETFGKPIWWNKLRPVHSILYLIFSYMAIKGNHSAYKVLLIDIFIGFFSFISLTSPVQLIKSSLENQTEVYLERADNGLLECDQ